VGEEHVRRQREPVFRPEHLLEVVDAVAVVVVGEPDRARAGSVDECAPDARPPEPVHHQGAARGAEVGGLDHFAPAQIPDIDLIAEAARVDA
jgi:hypothetical protein